MLDLQQIADSFKLHTQHSHEVIDKLNAIGHIRFRDYGDNLRLEMLGIDLKCHKSVVELSWILSTENIRELELGCNIEDVAPLMNLTSLTALYLNQQIVPRNLIELKRLRVLKMGETNDPAHLVIPESVEILDYTFNEVLSFKTFEHLKNLHTLSLHAVGDINKVQLRNFEILSTLPKLTTIVISDARLIESKIKLGLIFTLGKIVFHTPNRDYVLFPQDKILDFYQCVFHIIPQLVKLVDVAGKYEIVLKDPDTQHEYLSKFYPNQSKVKQINAVLTKFMVSPVYQQIRKMTDGAIMTERVDGVIKYSTTGVL